ncbi:MAG TPA: gluconate 2-dehydrogenase subunit 3 family protein [Xanthobacteraceae bacterium]|nr:gluconate 2-dehydrogenase subunit 3 family protein [Xanthobacteraceae bacterium]
MLTEPLDHSGILNFVAKYIARQPNAPVSDYAEPWRFPLIESQRAGADDVNRVTFVWLAASPSEATPVSVVGTFADLCDKTDLVPVLFMDRPTRYRAATVLVPAGQLHTYKFLVAAQPVLDPINPQRTVLDNGIEWSRFFTQRCAVPVSFEIWELAILVRLTNEILPFESRDAQRFMNLYYFTSDKQAHLSTLAHAYRLEQPIGAANFIDKIVAREERHRFIDYKICLRIIDGLLRRRFPGLTPAQISKDGYRDLYAEMARGAVDGWDVGQYQNPNYFLQILRRHTYMGAFSHPKYGGNAGAAGWAYLEEMFRGPAGESCFNWRRSIELPLGTSADYLG